MYNTVNGILVCVGGSPKISVHVHACGQLVSLCVLQLADVGCAVHLSSLLHQRYDDFCSLLFDNLQKIYSTGIGKDEDKVGFVESRGCLLLT